MAPSSVEADCPLCLPSQWKQPRFRCLFIVSSFRLPGSSSRPRFERWAEPFGHGFDPGRIAEGQAAPEGAADGLDLGFGLVGFDLASPRRPAGQARWG